MRALILVALVLHLSSGHAIAQEQYPEWRDAFAVYINDPIKGGGLVIDLARTGTDGLPPAALTVLGDAHLRRGNYGSARKMFLRALEDPTTATTMGPGAAPIAAHAQLGLAMASVGAGKLSDAREWFALASAAPGDMGHIATLGHAQTAIALGRHDEGLEILEALSQQDGLEPAVLDLTRFATGDALLDAGDPEAAQEAFQALAEGASGGVAADAAYAALIAKRKSGDREEAAEGLSEFITECPKEGEEDEGAERPKSSRAERELDPGAVLNAWVRNYREQAFDAYATNPAPVFSLRGCDLAVETAAVWEAEPVVEVAAAMEPAEPIAREPEGQLIRSSPPESAAVDTLEAESASSETTTAASNEGTGLGWIAALVIVGVAFLVGRFWRRG